LRADSALRVLVTSRLPLTWRDWRLVQLDLRGVSWLELDTSDDLAGRRHPVRGRSRPGLSTGSPVPGVVTASGSPVLATPPAVRLVAGTGRWRVEVRRAGGGPVLAAVEAMADGWQPDRLWQGVPRPLLGEVVISVTPLDQGEATGLRRTVTVAEGLAVAYHPALRLTVERGLEPAEAVPVLVPGMTVVPRASMIPPESTAVEVVCVTGPITLPLRLTPPHLRLRIEPEPGSGAAPTAWHSLGPLLLADTDLIRGGALRLDLPGAGAHPLIEVVARTQVVQVLEPSRLGRYPLRRMLDTVRACGGAALRITVGGRAAIIAHIRTAAGAADPWLPRQP
jgi:hypothetical protein